MLIRQRAEIERVTATLRVQNETETNPAIKAAREAQIERIKQARTETAALLELERSRLALFGQQQRLDMQALERQSMGMGTVDRARFLAEETERQRIAADPRSDPSSEQALERIRRAGEIAVGDEALRRVKEYTGAVQEIGSAFSDAFMRGIFEGKKLGDVFKDLDKQIAQIIFRTMVMKPVENAFSGIAGSIGNFLGSSFGGSSGAVSSPGKTSMDGGFKFANGGIMTEFGSVPLRRYSRGGIANSPQLAMFGEGSVAEAYVPVPSGRIPVEMRGGGGDTYFIDARGAEQGVEARIEAAIRRAVPGIVNIAKGSLAGDVNRGGRTAQTFGRRAA
jgi:hypothetical protein